MNEIVRIPLQSEGPNTVLVPVDAVFLAVVMFGVDVPSLAFLAKRGAANEQRGFYVTRQYLDEAHPVGDYVGFVQESGRAALHVFELGEKKGKKK